MDGDFCFKSCVFFGEQKMGKVAFKVQICIDS